MNDGLEAASAGEHRPDAQLICEVEHVILSTGSNLTEMVLGPKFSGAHRVGFSQSIIFSHEGFQELIQGYYLVQLDMLPYAAEPFVATEQGIMLLEVPLLALHDDFAFYTTAVFDCFVEVNGQDLIQWLVFMNTSLGTHFKIALPSVVEEYGNFKNVDKTFNVNQHSISGRLTNAKQKDTAIFVVYRAETSTLELHSALTPLMAKEYFKMRDESKARLMDFKAAAGAP